MTLQEILNRDSEFKYRLLNRMQQDCYGAGRLWAGSKAEQAKYMLAIWEDLDIKPIWLPLAELKELYYKLTNTEYRAAA